MIRSDGFSCFFFFFNCPYYGFNCKCAKTVKKI